MKNAVLFSLIFFLFSLSFTACSDSEETNLTPDPAPVSPEGEIKDALQKVIDETEMPGFTVAIVKNGEIPFQHSFGYADIAAGKPYTNQTTQPIGSISKTFIGAAIVKAVEEGYFTLETDINDILPVTLVNPKDPGATIRVKHLVTHTSGLVDDDYAYYQAYHILPGEKMSSPGAQLMANLLGTQQRPGIPLEEYLAEYYLEGGELYSENNFSNNMTGAVWQYSNIASSLAAYLIESAAGVPYDEYVAEKIFQPLGMAHTAFHREDLDMENRATLYFDKNTPLPQYANDSYPDGSVNTCNEDLTKYLFDMMRGAAGSTETLFSAAGYELLFSPLLPAGVTPAWLGENQGVFWILDSGHIKHDGGDPGLSTFMQFSENGDWGFLLLTNMDASIDETEEKFADAIMQIFDAIGEYIGAH